MADTLLGFLAHPLAIVAHIFGQTLGTLPGTRREERGLSISPQIFVRSFLLAANTYFLVSRPSLSLRRIVVSIRLASSIRPRARIVSWG